MQNGSGFFQKFPYVIFVIYISHTFAFFGCYEISNDTLHGKIFEYPQL